MNIANVITIVSLIICCNGCLSPAQILESTSASTDRMPKNWNLQEISAGALDPGGDEAIINSDILCWQVKEDGRPLRVEYCILWLHLKEKNKSIWRVIHMVRSPSRLNRWEPACVDGGWWDWRRDFDHAPSSSEVIAFIQQSDWDWNLHENSSGFIIDPKTNSFREISGFKYIDGSICQQNWEKRTGSTFKLDVPSEYLQ